MITQQSWSVKGAAVLKQLQERPGGISRRLVLALYSELLLFSAKPGNPSEDKAVRAGTRLPGEERAAGELW